MRAPAFFAPRPSRAWVPRSAACLALMALALGCTPKVASVEPSRSADLEQDAQPAASIATVHRRKCGNCHARVEPGSLPRATIEAAMVRHRRRAKLTDGQWAEMIEFLSHAGPTEPHQTASLP